MHARHIGLAALFAAGLVAPTIAGGAGPKPAASGRALYYAKGCYQCHGLVGQGSIYSGPALAGRNLTVQSIAAYTRAPRGIMPTFRPELVSDAELRTIADYIIAFPKGRPASSIPQLARLAPTTSSAPAGATSTAAAPGAGGLYGDFCAACHGAAREGGSGPALAGIGGRKTQAEIAAIIKSPPAGMPKLWPQPLADAQVAQIAALLAAQ